MKYWLSFLALLLVALAGIALARRPAAHLRTHAAVLVLNRSVRARQHRKIVRPVSGLHH